MDTNPATAANRRTLLDLTQGGYGYIKIEQCRFNFSDDRTAEPDADYCGPINVPAAEMVKFDAAVRKYLEGQGYGDASDYHVLKFGHRTHLEAVEDAKREYDYSPALVRHADGLYYMHGEDKPGRPTIINVLIDEILELCPSR